MDVDRLKSSYERLKGSESPYDVLFDFKQELLASDEESVLEFHYAIIQDEDLPLKLREAMKTFFYAEAVNARSRDKVAEFLHDKYRSGIEDTKLRAAVVQLLGNLRSRWARGVALENIDSSERELRWCSVLVLGWVGVRADLAILNRRLLSDPNPGLRGAAAAAMRQIWDNHPKTREVILGYLRDSLDGEEEREALVGIVLAAQSLLKKKFGLKESTYGDVSGDIAAAKLKALSALKKS